LLTLDSISGIEYLGYRLPISTLNSFTRKLRDNSFTFVELRLAFVLVVTDVDVKKLFSLLFFLSLFFSLLFIYRLYIFAYNMIDTTRLSRVGNSHAIAIAFSIFKVFIRLFDFATNTE